MTNEERIKAAEEIGNRMRAHLETAMDPQFPHDEQAARATCAEWNALMSAGREADAAATEPRGDEEFGA